jgi:hypothetical protein
MWNIHKRRIPESHTLPEFRERAVRLFFSHLRVFQQISSSYPIGAPLGWFAPNNLHAIDIRYIVTVFLASARKILDDFTQNSSHSVCK